MMKENQIIDVEWREVPVEDKPERAEWENNRTVAKVFLGSLAFFAWAVSIAVFL